MKNEKFEISGMTCASCQANVTRCVQKQPGVQQVNVSLLANQMQVSYDETKVSAQQLMQAVQAIGYGASPVDQQEGAGAEHTGFQQEWQRRAAHTDSDMQAMKSRLVSSVVLLVPLMYLSMGGMMGLPLPGFLSGMQNHLLMALTQFLITLPIVLINKHFFVNGLRSLAKRAPNMDSLVAIGAGASLLYGIYALYRMAYGLGHGDDAIVHQFAHALYFESSATVLTLVTVGKYLEARSKSKTSDALRKLVDLAPKTATVLRGGEPITIPSEQVVAGDIVLIKPGESIPVDGVLTEGNGFVDQSAITGESLPVEKVVGDTVISATINRNGSFRFRASRVGEDTTLAQIIRLVDDAGNSKAPIARLADKVSGVFVPVVIVIAVVCFAAWLLAGQGFEFALNCAVSVLVISCPCALGLATPVAIMVGTGKAAEYGILIKSAACLENLHTIDTIALDKTGTITEGQPTVTDILPLAPNMTERALLELAAAAEEGSEHPLAAAVVAYARQSGVRVARPEQFEMVAGRGVRAVWQGKTLLAGNLAFLQEQGIDTAAARQMQTDLAKQGKTPLVFACDGQAVGVVAVADTVRATSVQAIRTLQSMGIHTVMLTGDNELTAEAIRSQVGISEAISGVMPADKEACVRRLQQQGHRVAMVGDGINDAPALVRADIGIAIGGGTDIAMDSADVILMKSSLMDVVTALQLSKAVVRNIHMDLFWAFFYNVLGIPLAAGVLYPLCGLLLSPMIGSAAMSLSSVCVVTNALRLRWFQPKQIAPPQTTAKAPQRAPAAQPLAPAPAPQIIQKELKIQGMMCGHCQQHVQDALQAVDGVSAADVDWEKGTARVTLSKKLTEETLMGAVDAAGYTPLSCMDLE